MNKEEAEIFIGLMERLIAIVGIVDSFTDEEMAVFAKAKNAIITETEGKELSLKQKIAVDRIEMIEAFKTNLQEAKKEYPEEE